MARLQAENSSIGSKMLEVQNPLKGPSENECEKDLKNQRNFSFSPSLSVNGF